MDKNNLFDKLKELVGDNAANINILQEEIDVALQMEYFRLAKKIKKEIDPDKDYLIDVEQLYNPETTNATRRKIICILASFEKVEYYRALEKFHEHANEEIKPWVTLALQESRMLLESSLLDEKQLFVSTGLGGKGIKLRYFVALINAKGREYSPTQQNLVKNELNYALQQGNGELEEINFEEKFALVTYLLPIDKPVQQILIKFIKECNAIGEFIDENFLITNVKKLSVDEIKQFINRQKEKKNLSDIKENNDKKDFLDFDPDDLD
jgi:hypothetical protein